MTAVDEETLARDYVLAEVAGDEETMTRISQTVDRMGFPDSEFYDRFMDALEAEKASNKSAGRL